MNIDVDDVLKTVADYIPFDTYAVSNHLPAVLHLSPITVGGGAIVLLGLTMYFITHVRECLLVSFTALLYSVVPLMH